MQIGDLVTISASCHYGGEYAIVVEEPNCINRVKIVLINQGKTVVALVSNLEVVCK